MRSKRCAVTGAFYPELASLNTDRFSTQRPEAVNNLLKEAEARNLSLLSARLSGIWRASKSAQPKPAICRRLTSARQPASAIPNTTAPKPEARMPHATAIPMRAKIRSASASTCRCTAAVRPIRVKQAQYGFVGASEQLESSHRSVVQTVRSSFNNVNASISSINAYKQAVISAQSSLDAMEAGYQVGTRTIVDVLDATTTLYNAKRQLSDARYTYLINQLNIKSALGTLNQNDLLLLNGALGKPVSTAPDAVAPHNRAQDAYADGYQDNAPMQQTAAPAPSATRAAAPAVRQPVRNSGNPFRN